VTVDYTATRVNNLQKAKVYYNAYRERSTNIQTSTVADPHSGNGAVIKQ